MKSRSFSSLTSIATLSNYFGESKILEILPDAILSLDTVVLISHYLKGFRESDNVIREYRPVQPFFFSVKCDMKNRSLYVFFME